MITGKNQNGCERTKLIKSLKANHNIQSCHNTNTNDVKELS